MAKVMVDVTTPISEYTHLSHLSPLLAQSLKAQIQKLKDSIKVGTI